MKVSDYVVDFLVKKGIKQCFAVTGGFAMHLNDSMGQHMDVNYTHGENPAGYSALGWSSVEHRPSVCCVTAGCGATNAITPCLIAYQDSVPVWFISGQVHMNDNVRTLWHSVRSYFGSDCDIISMVYNITKYATELTDPKELPDILEKCYYNLTNGRLGPVWLSIPVDVQAMEVPEGSISTHLPGVIKFDSIPQKFYDVWCNSKRPLVLAGNGIHLSRTVNVFREKVKVPYVVSYFGSDLGPDYIGKVGLIGDRAGNFAVQNCDVLLCLGCRLGKNITGYDRKLFAPNAIIISIDIDHNELQLKQKNVNMSIHADLKTFFCSYVNPIKIDPEWIKRTSRWRSEWSRVVPSGDSLTCPYKMLDTFFVNKPAQSQVVASSGSLYCLAWHMYRPKEGDRYIASSHGDMGYELPVAIGACKNTEKRTFCLVGDGSFQLNVQELATLKLLQLPVTVMVFNNGGYGAIQITQNAQFGRLYGTEFETSIEGVAKGYGLPYYKVKDPSDTTYLDHTGPVVVEFECHVQERTPKISNRPLGNGKFENASYDNMYPFLDQEVLKINSFSP